MDDVELHSLVEQGMSIRKIAAHFTTTAAKVKTRLKKLNLVTTGKAGTNSHPKYRHGDFATKFNWPEIQKYYDSGKSSRECSKFYNVPSCAWLLAKQSGLIKLRTHGEAASLVHTGRKHRSLAGHRRGAAKRWSNPSYKANWKRNDKFKSVPCEKLKENLRAAGLAFEEEHYPLADRGFSIDIAFPKIKLGIEVNGNQHYSSRWVLKPYYQQRHDLIVAAGWTLLEIPFRKAFDENLIEEIKKLVLQAGLEPALSSYALSV